MKKLALLLSLMLAGGVAIAQETEKAAPAKQPAPHHALKTHTLMAEVVSTDAAAKTITVKGEKENATYPVEGAAIAELSKVKAGSKVRLTCRDNEKGEHQAVTAIRPEHVKK